VRNNFLFHSGVSRIAAFISFLFPQKVRVEEMNARVETTRDSTIEWAKCYGGSQYEGAYSIQQTSDDGCIFAAYTFSNDGDVSGHHNGMDAWVVKVDSGGVIEWQKCLGGAKLDLLEMIQQTTDGGYISVGVTESDDGDIAGNHGIRDLWAVKFDSDGNVAWQKCLGGSEQEGFSYASVQQTADGCYMIAGSTNSNDGYVSGNHGDYDAWVVKLAPDSDLLK
jgi:hypothetical protein